jgi:hypothetical protein
MSFGLMATSRVAARPDRREFDIEMVVHVQDRYNFNAGATDIATGTRDAENGRFEVTGLGTEFILLSTIPRKIEFSTGLEQISNYRVPPPGQRVTKNSR